MKLFQFLKTILPDWVPVDALKQISYLSFGEFFVYFTGFIYGVSGARILGPSGLGQLVLIISLIQISSAPFKLHYKRPLVKLIKDKEIEDVSTDVSSYLTSLLSLQFLGMFSFGLLFFVVLLILSPVWPIFADWQTALGLFALSEVLFNLRKPIEGVFQAKEDFQQLANYNIFNAVARDLFPICFMPFGINAVCFGYLAVELLFMAGLALFLTFSSYVTFRPVGFRVIKNHSMEFFRRGRSNYLTTLLSIAYSKMQNIILGHFAGSAPVGFYSVGKKMCVFLDFPLRPLKSYLYPRLIHKWSEDVEDFFGTLRRYFYRALPLFAVLGFAIVVLSFYLVPLIYGAAFQPAVLVILILIPANAIKTPFGIFPQLTLAVSEARYLLNNKMLELVAGMVLLIVLSWKYSYLGAASGFAITQIIVVTYQIYIFNSLFGKRWLLP